MKIYPAVITLLLLSCHPAFKKETPNAENGGNVFYRIAKDRQGQLNLDSIDNGFDDLEIRVWYDYALFDNRKLVLITHHNSKWQATVYDMTVNWDGQKETILSKDVRIVDPKSGWKKFVDQLEYLEIETLPDDAVIPHYKGGFDGATYNVEIAAKNSYRFYSYWEPQLNMDKIWQAQKMNDILKLFQNELSVIDSPMKEIRNK